MTHTNRIPIPNKVIFQLVSAEAYLLECAQDQSTLFWYPLQKCLYFFDRHTQRIGDDFISRLAQIDDNEVVTLARQILQCFDRDTDYSTRGPTREIVQETRTTVAKTA